MARNKTNITPKTEIEKMKIIIKNKKEKKKIKEKDQR